MKHTPLPLTADEDGRIYDAKGLVLGHIREWRLYMLGDKVAKDEHIIVAKHICVAVNCHDKLVAALKSFMGDVPGALEKAQTIITELEKT